MATTHMETVVGEEYPKQMQPSPHLFRERCHARCDLQALLEEEMIPRFLHPLKEQKDWL